MNIRLFFDLIVLGCGLEVFILLNDYFNGGKAIGALMLLEGSLYSFYLLFNDLFQFFLKEAMKFFWF